MPSTCRRFFGAPHLPGLESFIGHRAVCSTIPLPFIFPPSPSSLRQAAQLIKETSFLLLNSLFHRKYRRVVIFHQSLNPTNPAASHRSLSQTWARSQIRPRMARRTLAVRCKLLLPLPMLTHNIDLGFTPVVKVDRDWTVDKVVEKIPGPTPVEGSSSPVPFFHMLERLKTTKREGWRRFGIFRCVAHYL